MHYQAYLLEGIVCWNEDRVAAAIANSGVQTHYHTYDSKLRHEVNRVCRVVYGSDFDENYRDPGKYTGKSKFIFLPHFICRELTKCLNSRMFINLFS